MSNNGSYNFGPILRKPPKKKEPTELMKRSRKQLKKTRECYRVSYNNDNGQGGDNVHKRDTRHVTVVPRTNRSSGMESLPENIEESMPSSSRIVRKKIEIFKHSSLKANNGVVSSLRTTKSFSSPNIGLVPLGRKNESLKLRPSRLKNGFSSMSKDDSNSMFNISKEPQPSSIFGNSGIAAKIVNNEGQKEDISAEIEASSLSLKLKSNQGTKANTRIHLDSLPSKNVSSHQMVEISSNKERHANSMDEHIRHDSRKRNISLSEVGGIDDDKLKCKRMESSLQEKLETHEDDDDSEVVVHRSKKTRRTFIYHGDDEDYDGDQNLACAEKVIAGFTKSMECSIQLKDQNISHVEEGETVNDKFRKRTEPLSGENIETDEDNDSEEPENRRPTNRRRRLILTDYEDDDDGDQNLVGVEIGTAGLTKQTDVVKLQQYGSLPIDEPVWRGIIKISSNKNVSLAAHLSTKCCKEVWNLAGSLQQEIIVTKLSRMEAWPKSFVASRPTDDNIALYFLPCEMRQDANLDQLVKEVVEDDMVLQAVVGEAQMLIFPSVLLPEQHQTFQGKPYLWAVFKRRKNKLATAAAQQHDKGRCAQDEIGKQQASHCSVGKEGHRVTGLNTDIGIEAPKEVERQSMELEQNPSLASANTPSPATVDPTINAPTSANHGQTHSSLAVPTGAWFGFVVHGNPRTDQLIQELQREGALMVAMRGEMIGSGLGQATATGREENEVPPSSTGRAAMV